MGAGGRGAAGRRPPLDDVQRLTEDLTSTGAESGSVLLATGALWLQANVLYRRGALADAEACFSAVADTAAAHGFITVSGWAGAQYATVLLDRGDHEAARQVLRRLAGGYMVVPGKVQRSGPVAASSTCEPATVAIGGKAPS